MELATGNQKQSATWWELGFSRDGRVLFLGAQSDEGMGILAKAEVNFQAGQWYLLTLEYSPINTSIFIDSQLVAIGHGLPTVPEVFASITSLVIGSDIRGRNAAEGLFDEFTTFDYLYPGWPSASYYQATRRQAELGPIVSLALEKARAAWDQARARTLQTESLDSGSFSMLMAESGLRLTPPNIPATNTAIAFLTLLEADTNKSYNIYFTPALGMTNTAWNLIAAQGAQGQTNFTVSVTNTIGFFQAAEGNDWDNDGVLNYMDANPTNSSIGALTVMIEVPGNGSTVD